MTEPTLATMKLRDLLASQTPRRANINFAGLNFPVAFTPATNMTDKVLIKFHGAVNRGTRAVPVFIPPDPSLGSGLIDHNQ